MNLCQTRYSCSACCGINNLTMPYIELRGWLKQNTEHFLKLNLSKAEQIVQFRLTGEKNIENKKHDPTTYTCPFIGYIDKNRTGCLLHPVGSPHPQIGLLKHPQNFSFYGESICQTYDCQTKENEMANLSYGYNQRNYSRFIPNYNLHIILKNYSWSNRINVRALHRILLKLSETLNVHISSFELTKRQEKKTFINALTEAFLNETPVGKKRKKGIKKIINTYAYRNQ